MLHTNNNKKTPSHCADNMCGSDKNVCVHSTVRGSSVQIHTQVQVASLKMPTVCVCACKCVCVCVGREKK